MRNLNIATLFVMLFASINLLAQDTKRIPTFQKVEKSTTVKELPQQKNVPVQSVKIDQSSDTGLKKATKKSTDNLNYVVPTQAKEFSTEEKAMIQHRASIKDGGFYNSRANIENRKRAILQNYLGLDSINDPAYPAKKKWLAENYPEKYAAFIKEMSEVTISKTSK